MGRWTPDEHGCIYDEAGCFARLTPNKAERLASRHNADIDSLTAERDELQRRLDAVVMELKPGKPPCDCITEIGPRCSCMNQGDAANVEAWWTTMCHYRRAVAIAEGREG